ncbi:MAG: DUF523 domain-containing protein [Synergistaceae bacterium]|nr:DUF523 domain-containing protein [Synergistaceae bacterium]MBP9975460.1 DUF523 domain-containing protein [Synergistaceae bacterium]
MEIYLKILVSACLLGINSRYCGGGCLNEKIASLIGNHNLIPVCPEQLGGLPTPREPDEIREGRVFEKSGKENTDNFQKGAEETLRLARLLKVDMAILKQNSPSCGSSMIYDGTFSSKKIPGSGITASLLIENGIRVISEEDIAELRELFKQP